MAITNTLNKYKRYIVILGFIIGGTSTLGMLPPQPISSLPEDTTKMIYTIIIAGCGVVFLKFFKPLRIPPPQPPTPRRPAPRQPAYKGDNSDVFGDIDNTSQERQTGPITTEKASIYDGFK